MSNWNKSLRQLHRWVSITFMLVVVAVGVAAIATPPDWVFFTPVPLLFVLMLTGVYLFALPYAARRRRGEAEK